MYKAKLHKYQEKMFDLIIYATYVLMVLSYLGLNEYAPTYLSMMDYYVRIYISLFLIWRFNPLRMQYEFTDLDRKIAYSAGVFILTTTALKKYIDFVKDDLTNIFNRYIRR
jgi:hypothetical protein